MTDNTIICGDCLDIMKDWPDGCVDLVLTDPPYGIKYENNFGIVETSSFRKIDVEWDVKPPAECFTEIFRLSKNQIVWGGNYFLDSLKPTRCMLVWDKLNGNNPYADGELAWTSFSSGVKIFQLFWLGSHARRLEPAYHPTQKPLLLMMWCLKNYSKPNDLILDPFCGSGTTCLAAKMLGRRYIGIDISQEYVNIANERIAAYNDGVPVKERRKGQKSLFGGVDGSPQV